jgi:hypothetical protein
MKSTASLVLALSALLLSGCVTPQKRKEFMSEVAAHCLKAGGSIGSARPCLAKSGLEAAAGFSKGEHAFQKCGPYWGWPFMASCGGIVVTTQDEAVVSWRTWGALDGI